MTTKYDRAYNYALQLSRTLGEMQKYREELLERLEQADTRLVELHKLTEEAFEAAERLRQAAS